MSDSIKTYTVTICGSSYTLRSDESSALVSQAAHIIDKRMSDLCAAAPSLSRERVAVLVALQCARELIEAQNTVSGVQVTAQRIVDCIDAV